MAGFIDFTDGNYFTEIEADLLMRQSVMRFATVALRDAALVAGIVEKSMMAYTEDTLTLSWYDGATWRPIESHWQSWTPAWLNGVAGSPIAIGNGSLTGRWRYSGGKAELEIRLLRGSTTNLGTTGWVFSSLPVAMGSFRNNGPAAVLDASAPITIPHMLHGISTNELAIAASSGRRIDNNGFGITPTAWAAGDDIVASIRYEI